MMSRSSSSKTEDVTALSLKESDDIWIAPYSETTRPDNKNVAPAKNDVPEKKDDRLASADDTAVGQDIAEGSGESSLTKGLEYPAEGQSTASVDKTAENLAASGASEKVDSQRTSSDGTVTTTFDLCTGSATSSAVTAQNKAAEKAMKNADSRRGEMAKTLDESTKKSSSTAVTKASSETKPVVASVKSATKPSGSASKSEKASPKSEKKTAEASSRIPDRYWVQAASYSSKKKADEARAVLDENMVQCEVFTFEMDGTLYYRVRVGPYTTKTEAAYWKKQVDSLEQFADAGTYIVNSSAPIAKK